MFNYKSKMLFIKLFTIFIIIEYISSDIDFKGGNQNLFFEILLDCNRISTKKIRILYFWILDCNPLEAFVNLTDHPAWSPCQAYKNKTNDCGEGQDTPFTIYETLSFASRSVCYFHPVLYIFS